MFSKHMNKSFIFFCMSNILEFCYCDSTPLGISSISSSHFASSKIRILKLKWRTIYTLPSAGGSHSQRSMCFGGRNDNNKSNASLTRHIPFFCVILLSNKQQSISEYYRLLLHISQYACIYFLDHRCAFPILLSY